MHSGGSSIITAGTKRKDQRRWQHQWQPQEDHCLCQQHHQYSFAHRRRHRPALSSGSPAPVFFSRFSCLLWGSCCTMCERKKTLYPTELRSYIWARWGVLACVSMWLGMFEFFILLCKCASPSISSKKLYFWRTRTVSLWNVEESLGPLVLR